MKRYRAKLLRHPDRATSAIYAHLDDAAFRAAVIVYTMGSRAPRPGAMPDGTGRRGATSPTDTARAFP